MKVYHWLDSCWGSLFPPTCMICLGPGSNAMAICESCLQDLPWHQPGCRICADQGAGVRSSIRANSGALAGAGGSWAHRPALICGRCLRRPPAFERVLAALNYGEPIDHLIRRLKFDGALPVGRLLSQLFLYRCAPPPVDALVPVPLHRERLRQRGFNQATELARFLARDLNLPVGSRWLLRTRNGLPQSTLLAVDRRRGMAGMFEAVGPVAGKRIALIDDVLTTGSTANACARSLLRGGAASVQIWVISRA